MLRPSNKALPRVIAVVTVMAAVLALPQPASAKKHHAPKLVASELGGTVTVTLPPGDDVYPDKVGATLVDRNCLACHSPEIVANQPTLTRQIWTAEVNKMRTAFKAPIADEDVAPIIDYLVSLRGAARAKWR